MRDTSYSVEVDGQVIEASSEHPFYVQGEWKETKNLDVGDKLTLFNQDCESSIASITIEARRDTVYNLSVADFETYFVSELGILVHNCGGKTKTYQTYTKKNKNTGEVYSGRTSGTGTPDENIAKRDKNHHMNDKGFGKAKLDKSSSNSDAIRGREQQNIDANGGAKSGKGGTSGNAIRGVGPNNKKASQYEKAANKEFGGG